MSAQGLLRRLLVVLLVLRARLVCWEALGACGGPRRMWLLQEATWKPRSRSF